MSGHESKLSFFKQGGWMVIATGLAGVFMILVHMVSNRTMSKPEYAELGALLKLFLFLGIPATGLQTVFAREAAAAVDPRHAHELATMTRVVLGITFAIWLGAVVTVLCGWNVFMRWQNLQSGSALAFTLMLGLPALWMPLVKGLLQGHQQFGGLGWISIVDGVVRFGTVLLLLVWVGGGTGSAMGAVLLAQVVSLAVGGWLTRGVWLGKGETVAWRPWLKIAVPLTLGSGAIVFVSLADMLYAKSVFENGVDLYVAGQNSGFALSQMTVPLSAVMFPKIARSVARSEKTSALAMTLQSTLAVGGGAAVVCTLVPSLPLHAVYFFSYEKVAAAGVLVPWSVWSLLLFATANVLVSNLLARRTFRIVPWLVAVAVAYGLTLWGLKPALLRQELMSAFRIVIQVQLVYSGLLLAIGIYFTKAKAE